MGVLSHGAGKRSTDWWLVPKNFVLLLYFWDIGYELKDIGLISQNDMTQHPITPIFCGGFHVQTINKLLIIIKGST